MSKTFELNQSFDREQFLQAYWQQKPCVIKEGFTSSINELLDPNIIAGLSLEEFVESRLVFNSIKSTKNINRKNNNATSKEKHWELKNGPFKETELSELPEQNWCLLVQAADLLLPEIRSITEQFSFIPRWRFDDAMVSLSGPGGNVGPHVDAYDVFLIQASGQKTWEIMDIEKKTPQYYEHESLKIISNWQADESHLLEPGDILYLPPGIGHFGYSKELCTTISVGFRSPEVTQISDLLINYLIENKEPVIYSDPNPPAREHPGVLLKQELLAISQIAQNELRSEAFLLEIAQLISAPKYAMEDREHLGADEFTELLSRSHSITPSNDARIFQLDSPKGLMVVNGTILPTTGVPDRAVYHLTNYQSIPCKEVLNKDNNPLFELVHNLYNLGAIEINQKAS